MRKPKLWFSYTSTEYPFKDEEYGFYPKKDFEWVSLLEENYELLKKEALSFLEKNTLDPYFNKSMVSKPNGWKTKGLLFWGQFSKRNYKHFKATWAILKKIKGISAFSISCLDRETVIKPHRGDTNAIIRIHLPLIVPGSIDQCSFTVKGEKRNWEEGKALLFNDAQEHEAQNLSEKPRVVLILDVIRPEFLDQRFDIQSKVLNGLAWQWISQDYPSIRSYPLFVKKLIWASTRLYYQIQGRLNKWFIWP